jgi:hypothetical protein
MFLNQGTSQPEASQQEENGDMASSELEELVELDEVQLATVVVGGYCEYCSKWRWEWKEMKEREREARGGYNSGGGFY